MAFKSLSFGTIKEKNEARKARRDAAKRRRDDKARAETEAKKVMKRREAEADKLRESMAKKQKQEPPAKRTRIDTDSKPAKSSTASAPVTSPAVPVLDLATPLKLENGCRLEVLWTVEESDEDSAGEVETAVWWGCTYIGPKAGVHKVLDDGENQNEKVLVQVCELLYDAKPPHFPESTVNASAFLSEHQLYDIDFDGCLAWRHKGSSWEPHEEPPSSSPLSVTDGDEFGICLGSSPEQLRLRITNIVNNIVLNVAQRNQHLMDSASMGHQLFAGDALSEWRSTIIETLFEHATKHGKIDLKTATETIAKAREKLKHRLP